MGDVLERLARIERRLAAAERDLVRIESKSETTDLHASEMVHGVRKDLQRVIEGVEANSRSLTAMQAELSAVDDQVSENQPTITRMRHVFKVAATILLVSTFLLTTFREDVREAVGRLFQALNGQSE